MSEILLSMAFLHSFCCCQSKSLPSNWLPLCYGVAPRVQSAIGHWRQRRQLAHCKAFLIPKVRLLVLDAIELVLENLEILNKLSPFYLPLAAVFVRIGAVWHGPALATTGEGGTRRAQLKQTKRQLLLFPGKRNSRVASEKQ